MTVCLKWFSFGHRPLVIGWFFDCQASASCMASHISGGGQGEKRSLEGQSGDSFGTGPALKKVYEKSGI